MIAILGGSGLRRFEGFEVRERRTASTPYGAPSAPLGFGRLGRSEIVFLARHGEDHTMAHQIIDYTWGRASTFFEGPGVPLTHVDFTKPYTEKLRQRLLKAAAGCGEPIGEKGVYAATQGPRLETAAEIDRLARDGADIVGMTAMPEAGLARLCEA